MTEQTLYDLPPPNRLNISTSSQQKKQKNPNTTKINQLFTLPYFKTNASYQNNVKKIIQSITQLDVISDNLQNKVNKLLAAYRNQFVQAYKQHMKKIQTQFTAMEEQVITYQQLIKIYQNQGKMANLMKKVAMVQQQSKKLYGIIQKKQKQIKAITLQIEVQKQQNKRLTAQVKSLMKFKTQASVKFSKIQQKQKGLASSIITYDESALRNVSTQQDDPQNFFTTSIMPHHIREQRKLSTIQRSKKYFQRQLINKDNYHTLQQDIFQYTKIKKKLQNILKKNKQLVKFNSKILSSKSEFQNIFINSVNQIKKQIMIKKKINFCSFQDFKKQDKINLLLTIISNQQLLSCLYQKIFTRQPIAEKNGSTVLQKKGSFSSNPLLMNNHKMRRKTSAFPTFEIN